MIKEYTIVIEFTASGELIEETKYPRGTKPNRFDLSDSTSIFHVKDIVETTVEVDNKKVVCRGELTEHPTVYYVNGWIYNLEEIKTEYPQEIELIKRLEMYQSKSDLPIRVVKVEDKFILYGSKNRIWKTKKLVE